MSALNMEIEEGEVVVGLPSGGRTPLEEMIAKAFEEELRGEGEGCAFKSSSASSGDSSRPKSLSVDTEVVPPIVCFSLFAADATADILNLLTTDMYRLRRHHLSRDTSVLSRL